MEPIRVVLDTNVLVSAMRSRKGASFALVSSIPSPRFQICLSVALYSEWRSVLSRAENLPPGRTAADAHNFVRYLASQSHLQQIHFLWRPLLQDADDDMVLELAIAAGCQRIITHNTSHFARSNWFGTEAVTPRQFLTFLRAMP